MPTWKGLEWTFDTVASTYEKLRPSYVKELKYYEKERETISEYTEQQAKELAMIASKYGFSDIRYALFYRERAFSAKEYMELLGTYSDHIAMAENIRTEFFAKIEEAIHKHGGKITIYDTMDLQLARKG